MRGLVKLILARHALRASQGVPGNESLSDRGKFQAAELAAEVAGAWASLNPVILSSPKSRALETAEAIAARFSGKVQTLDILDECRGNEPADLFQARVDDFLTECRVGAWSNVVLAVSHSDWLELAASSLLRDSIFIQWPPAAAHLFELSGSKAIHLRPIKT
jgi:broad specificity phosphatase PhoE